LGKWSVFKKSLPAKTEDQTYQDQVNKAKATILEAFPNLDMGGIGEMYGKTRAAKEAIEEELSGCNLSLAALEQMLMEQFDAQNIDMIRLEDGSSVSRKDDVYTSVEDRSQFLAWIDETGKRDLLSVHYQTMNSLAKQMLEAGQNLPPGIKAFFRSGFSFRKATKTT
jgi:hypothetical protein